MEGADSLRNIVYGCTFVDSPRDQEVTLFVPEGYAVKVWVNGVLLSHTWRIGGGPIPNFVYFLTVTLKAGRNVLLFGSQGGNSGLPGFGPGTEYTAGIPGVMYTLSDSSINSGDTFTLGIGARNIIDLAGWQADIAFDPNVLEAVEVTEGDFLKSDDVDTFYQAGTIENSEGRISGISAARIADSGVNGTGVLLSVVFTAKAGGETQLVLENFEFGTSDGTIIPTVHPNITITVEDYPPWDVNRDGRVSVLDLILVAGDFGSDSPSNLRTDVNSDGAVNIQDLIIVSQRLGESTDSAAAPVVAIDSKELTLTMVQTWIDIARAADDGSLAFQQGIANLERLLASLIPEKTALLANYPNPFNPETWIPYHLAKSAEVTLTIYAGNGAVVRKLELGHQAAGIYQGRSRAAYWDGRNSVGESVASGIYFYTLSAGDFTGTRKMLIRK